MPMKLKSMKGIDLSCASPASTAICSNFDQRSIIKNSTKPLHRFNSYLGDHYKTLTNNSTYSPSRAPCISELPFTPRPSSFSSYRDKTTRKLSASGVNHSDVVMTRRRRSPADITDLKRLHSRHKYTSISSTYDRDTTCHSSRYLLSESRYLDSLSENETTNKKKYSTPVFGGAEARKSTGRVDTRRFGTLLDDEKEKIRKHFSLIDVGTVDDQRKQRNAGESLPYFDGQTQRQSSMATNDSLLPKPRSPNQVVVLRVSLHCKGCENKLKKHLSKMHGVTTYNIDMETKKVTVTGNVTPSEVLTSISKVKNAQFWPSQASSSSSTSSSSSSSSSTIDLN